MDRKPVLLLALLLLLIPLVTSASTPQMRQVAEVTVNDPRVTIYSVVPYDNGVVITMGYTNFTFTGPSPVGSSGAQISYLYVYFVNSSSKYLMFQTTTQAISHVSAFVKDGELYVVVISLPSFGSISSAQTDVYVFKGLRLVNTYTVNGILTYLRLLENPLFNLSALVLIKANPESTVPNFNSTLILNSTNITLVNTMPLAVVGLPQGVLVASMNLSYVGSFESIHPVPLNVTLYGYDGKALWSKVYKVSPFSSFTAVSTSGSVVLTETYAAVVGNKLFAMNITSLSNAVFTQNVTVNVTVVGISLDNGDITVKLNLTDVPPRIGFLNIGGHLYVLVIGEKDAIVEKFNGTSWVTVAKVPLSVEVKRIPVGGYIEGNKTVYRYANFTQVVSSFLYYPGKYLLILNPTPNGTTVTDVYPGGLVEYTLRGNVTGTPLAKYALLLNESNNFSLAILNDNGTLRGTINLGNLTPPSSLFGFVQLPGVHVAKINDYSYYVVVERHNSTNNTSFVVYEVTFPKSATSSAPPASTTSTVPSASSTNLAVPVAAIVAIVVVVAAVLALRRRK